MKLQECAAMECPTCLGSGLLPGWFNEAMLEMHTTAAASSAPVTTATTLLPLRKKKRG